MELFQLVNPDKLSITCVGYAPSCRRRCRNPIAFRNVQAAKTVMRQAVRPGVSNTDLKEMLFDLAEYTLCQRYHQDQATNVSNRWFGMVQRHRDDEDDHGSDTSDDDDDDSDDGASSTSSSSDDSEDHDNDDAEEVRRRFDELETLQREFEELLQRQRQSLQDRMSRSTLTTQRRQPQENQRQNSGSSRSSNTQERRDKEAALRKTEHARQESDYLAAQRAREATREQLRRDRAERAKREEAQRQAQAQREAEEKAKAEAEAERLRKKKQEAEKARLDRERQAKEQKEQQQSRVSSWETAWLRYETAWANIAPNSTNTPVDTDIRVSQIWPTKSGSFASCCEEDVRAFFRCQPGDVNRRMLRRQALRWHPDRAARLFAYVADEVVLGELLRTVTMISQVVIGIMGVAAQ